MMLLCIFAIVRANTINIDNVNIIVAGNNDNPSWISLLLENVGFNNKNLLPMISANNDGRFMYIDAVKIIQNNLIEMFDFMYHYPCDGVVKQNFRKTIENNVGGLKTDIIRKLYLDSNGRTHMSDDIFNFVAYKFKCYIGENSYISYNGVNIFTCKINSNIVQQCVNLKCGRTHQHNDVSDYYVMVQPYDQLCAMNITIVN